MRCQRCGCPAETWYYVGGYILCEKCFDEALEMLTLWIEQYKDDTNTGG